MVRFSISREEATELMARHASTVEAAKALGVSPDVLRTRLRALRVKPPRCASRGIVPPPPISCTGGGVRLPDPDKEARAYGERRFTDLPEEATRKRWVARW